MSKKKKRLKEEVRDTHEIHDINSMTHHSGVGILSAITERRSQGARAALVVMGVFSVIDGTVYAHGPHACRVAVAVAVVVLASVARGPHVYVAQALTTLFISKNILS